MNNHNFSLDLRKFSDVAEKKMRTVVKKSFIGLSSDIIKDTPVDEGRLRNNWFPAVNKFSSETTDAKDKNAKERKKEVEQIGNTFDIGDELTLSNNLPYAEKAEFGLYGDGPKTVNGYSKKAPQGMVKKNIIRWQYYLNKEAGRLK